MTAAAAPAIVVVYAAIMTTATATAADYEQVKVPRILRKR